MQHQTVMDLVETTMRWSAALRPTTEDIEIHRERLTYAAVDLHRLLVGRDAAIERGYERDSTAEIRDAAGEWAGEIAWFITHPDAEIRELAREIGTIGGGIETAKSDVTWHAIQRPTDGRCGDRPRWLLAMMLLISPFWLVAVVTVWISALGCMGPRS